jgi:hypothetical protein
VKLARKIGKIKRRSKLAVKMLICLTAEMAVTRKTRTMTMMTIWERSLIVIIVKYV